MKGAAWFALAFCLHLAAQNRGPVVLSNPAAEYTAAARAAGVEGVVVLRATIGVDGGTHDIQVIQSLGLGLDENAAAAIANWRFLPAEQDGQAVERTVSLQVRFQLPYANPQTDAAAVRSDDDVASLLWEWRSGALIRGFEAALSNGTAFDQTSFDLSTGLEPHAAPLRAKIQ